MSEFNYFNFFTEIEEYFWRKRGAHLLVSPMDWAIMETWQKAGIPVEAVQKGIDRAFESYGRSRRGAAGGTLKSLAYCVDAVLEAGAEARETASGRGPRSGRVPSREPFTRSELRQYIERNAHSLRVAAASQSRDSSEAASGKGVSSDIHTSSEGFTALKQHFQESASRLEDLLPLVDSSAPLDLEDLERRLTVLEEKLSATLLANSGEAVLLAIREEMDRALASYRRKMDAAQLGQLERQYQQKKLYDIFRVPRLSLFYLT